VIFTSQKFNTPDGKTAVIAGNTGTSPPNPPPPQTPRARGAREGGNAGSGGKHFTVWVPISVWCLNCLGGCYIGF